MSRRGLYTIAPHAPFLPLLVERVLDGTLLKGWPREGAFWLSDVTIVLPTRRARLVLADLFATRLGGAALLPDIRTFGGEVADEEPFLPPLDMPPIPPVASPLERRLILSRLVRQFALSGEGFASPPNAAEIFWLADSLGQLIDDLTIEGVAAAKLKELVPEALAGNWAEILKFLDIVLEAWPAILRGLGKVDAAAARNERLGRQAAAAGLLYGERPVIAAGSTGSIPATSALLKAIAALPRGALVLPGLDTSLSATQHAALLDGDNMEGHPQYGLAKLLRGLDAGIADVEELAGEAPRTELVRHALAPAEETRDWAGQRGASAAALAGVSVLSAPNADLEARAIALAARQALVEKKSVGIVTRDQTLARRIAAELRRHGIAVDDPAGTPLYQAAAGRLARQVLAVVDSRFAPVDVVALLRNGAVTLGLERVEVSRLADRLDWRLRGERPLPGLAGLVALVDDDSLGGLLAALGVALQPLTALLDAAESDAGRLAAALLGAVEALIGAGRLPGLEDFRAWATALSEAADAGAPFPPNNLDALLKALMAGSKVQNAERRRDDIHIWGELEARLQSPDLMILAGVNDGVWPAAADPGPWLSRGMRIGIGLEPPERQQGQAAHDFEMALGNAQVLIAYAERLGTAPALPSRLVQRLDAFAGEGAARQLRARGTHWLDAARALDRAAATVAARMPQPRPPTVVRPKRLSVTEIETLIRSPYDLYARHVLRLRPRLPLGAEIDQRERGSLIHEIFARFIGEHDVMAPDAAVQLLALATESFSGLDAMAERRDIWMRRFTTAAEAFLEFERGRDGRVAKRHAEIDGDWMIETLGGFRLVGRADRIDAMADGTIEIFDFKTGSIPSPKEMRNFDAPQLLLEAAMARQGAFAPVGGAATGALTYIKIGLGPEAFIVTLFKTREEMSLMAMADEAFLRMQKHVAALLLDDRLPLLPRIRPRVNRTYRGDYEHLARTDEWTLVVGSEAE